MDEVDVADLLVLTVDELITHLTDLKENGSINGSEPVLDTGYFGITHVGIHSEAATPFVTLESEEINEAESEINRQVEAKRQETNGILRALNNIVV